MPAKILRKGSKYERYLTYNFKRTSPYIILGIMFLIGVFIGTQVLTHATDEFKNMFMEFMGFESNITEKKGFINVIVSAFTSQAILLIIIFIMGLCAIGQPVTLFIFIYQGLGFGLISSYCYHTGDYSDILYLIIVITPKMIMSILLLMVGALESIKMSTLFMKSFFQDVSRDKSKPRLKIYIARFIALLVGSGVYASVYGVIDYLYAII